MTCVVLVFLSSCGAAHAATAPAELAKAIAHRLDLQTAMPAMPTSPATPAGRQVQLFNVVLPHDIVSMMLWGAIILGAAAIIWSMRDNLPLISRSRRLNQEAMAAPGVLALAARMDEAQVEADDLARRGLFAEAMHVLLLQSLSELRQRLQQSFSASMTSREILHHLALPDAARLSLGDLIARVERAYFGDHAVSATDYGACRDSYEALTAALGAATPRRMAIPPAAAA